MKQELKPVLHNGHVLLVDEKAEIKKGDWAFHIQMKEVGEVVYITHHEVVDDLLIKTKENDHLSSRNNFVKVVAQPIGSNIPSIPYYQTEEETVDVESIIKKLNDISRFNIIAYSDSEYVAYKERESDKHGDYIDAEEIDAVITSLRKPRRIVSAVQCMEIADYTTGLEMPIFYTKEIDGKMLEFLKLDLVYE